MSVAVIHYWELGGELFVTSSYDADRYLHESKYDCWKMAGNYVFLW